MAFNGCFASRGSAAFDDRNGDPAYARDRQAIDHKLKSRFERIFEKYAKDFSSVGDEIDIESGEVVVNNGHLTHMQHERDTGKSASAQFLRDFEKELDEEDEGEEEDGDNEGDVEGAEDVEDEGNESDTGEEQSIQDSEHHSDDQDELALDPSLAESNQITPSYDSNPIVHSTEVMHPLPSIPLGESLNSLLPHQDASGRIDPAAIHALGQNIANQIAQFLMGTSSTTSRLNAQPRSVWDAPPLPSDAFSRASFHDHRRFSTPLPDRYPSVLDSPSAGQSIWAPTESRNKRRKLLQHSHRDHRGTHDSDGSENSFHHHQSRQRFYSRDEDDLIKRLRDERGLTWSQITTYMPGRSAGAVSARYTRALKHLTRPVIVKREVIEIMDGDDDIPTTPEQSHIPGNVPGSGPQAFTSPRRPPPKTPLLRQALENQIARNGDTGDLPITIGDDDTDTDSNHDHHVGSPSHIRPDGHGGFYQVHRPVDHFGRAIYSPASSSAEEAQGSMTMGPPKKPSRPHSNKNMTPAYAQFTSSEDVGSFGILRSENPSPMKFVSQEEMIGPICSTSGAFGILKVLKEKTPRKRSNPKTKPVGETNKSFVSSKLAESRVPGDPSRSKNFQTSRDVQYDAEMRGSSASLDTPMQHTGVVRTGVLPEDLNMETPSRSNVIGNRSALQLTVTEQDEGNDGDVSEPDTTETPAQRRYRDEAESALHNGPYFLSNLPPRAIVKGPGSDGDVFNSPRVGDEAPTPQRLQPPSSPPLLPTPRSEVSAKSSLRESTRTQVQKDAPPPPPGPGEVAVMTVLSAPDAAEGTYGTPKTPVRKKPAPTKRQEPVRTKPAPAKRKQSVKSTSAPAKSKQPVKRTPAKSKQPVKKTPAPIKLKKPARRVVPAVAPAEGSEDELAL